MVNIPKTISMTKSKKTFSVYIEIIATGDNLETVRGVIEDQMDDMFGAENYKTHDVCELTEDEIIELETGVNDDFDEDDCGECIDDIPPLEDEKASDELG